MDFKSDLIQFCRNGNMILIIKRIMKDNYFLLFIFYLSLGLPVNFLSLLRNLFVLFLLLFREASPFSESNFRVRI